MSISEREYVQIKKNLQLWEVMEPEHVDHDALCDVFREMRTVLRNIVTAQDEGETPTLFQRILRAIYGW